MYDITIKEFTFPFSNHGNNDTTQHEANAFIVLSLQLKISILYRTILQGLGLSVGSNCLLLASKQVKNTLFSIEIYRLQTVS